MPVYVDSLRDWGWRYGASCHLIADTLAELHAFAERIGMKRSWFQEATKRPHYDLTAQRRARAVQLGAVELTNREFIAKLKQVQKQ